MSAIEHLQWRYAVKKFNQGRLSEQQVSFLIESVRLAPSAFGLQPYQLLVLATHEAKAKVLPHCFGQDKVVDCSHLLILAHKTCIQQTDIDTYISGLALAQNIPKAQLSQYQQQIETSILSMTQSEQAEMAKLQCFIALGTLLTTAASVQIDTCPMTGFDVEGVDRVLGLKQMGLSASVLCPAGFRDDEDGAANRPKYRMAQEELAVNL